MNRKIKQFILQILRALHILGRVPLGLKIVNFIFQKILRLNSKFKIPVHFTSNVSSPDKLYFSNDENTLVSFAISGNCYIQAYNKIYLGKNILFAKGLNLISANHSSKDIRTWDSTEAIKIGDDVWIGTNVTILPGVIIGNNCIIGAGAIVTKSFKEENLIIAGNPASVISKREIGI